MAQPGTGVQLAAVGPENLQFDLDPQGTFFRKRIVTSSRFAAEAHEELPLQTAKFGHKAVFPVRAHGDLLGDMHVQIRVPAVQATLGVNLPMMEVPPVLAPASIAHSSDLTVLGVSLHGFEAAQGTSAALADGTFYRFAEGGATWEVVVHDAGRIVSTLRADEPGEWAPRSLVVGTRAFSQQPNSSVSVLVVAGEVIAENDVWPSPLAYMLMRRVRLLVDGMVIHNQERLWYDLSDQLSSSSGLQRGVREALGDRLSMGRAHTIVLPLRFLCCRSHVPRSYFPMVLVPRARVSVELELEGTAGLVPSSSRLPIAWPTSLDMTLVVEHVYLDDAERSAMLLQPLTVMYESEQDADAMNYETLEDGTNASFTRVGVDLSEFNLPVKSLVWVVYDESIPRPFDYLDLVADATLYFGSLERIEAGGLAYSRQQPWSHARRCPPGNVYTYSFALEAWRSEPCGAADFGALQKPVLRMKLHPEASSRRLKIKVFGVTYNWLTFRGGGVSQVFST